MQRQRNRALALLLLLLAAVDASAAVYTVGPPGSTAGCTHTTIQAAINAAAASPGLDIIRIARGTYPAQHLFIGDAGDLAIEGGFLECATLVPMDYSILDGQGAVPPGPIIDHRGAGSLTLSDLHIQNGEATAIGTTLALGGGVSSSGAGALTIRHSILAANHAYYGGGLYVATSAPPKGVTLTGVSFGNNHAEKSGGGIYAQLCDLSIDGDEVSYFGGNYAEGTDVFDGGGAIYANNCNVTVDARMPGTYPFMDNNWTNGSGGAIYFANDSGASLLWMAPRRGGGALELGRNDAGIIGGAINAEAVAANAHVSVQLYDAIVSDNNAPQGSAFYLYADGASAYARLAMSPRDTCSAQGRCNRIDGNVSDFGGTIHTEQTSGGATSLQIRRGYLIDNIALNGGSVINGYGIGGDTMIDTCVVANNDAGNAPVFNLRKTTHVQNSTIAGNLRVSPSVLRAYGSTTDVYLHNSIAFQPEAPLTQAPDGAAFELRNLLLSAAHPVGNEAPRNIQYSQDPLFVDPGQDDFRIQAGSQARNRWSPGGGVDVPLVDLLGATRPAPGDSVTPYDFGAYEYGAVVDAIFADDFDGAGIAFMPQY